MRINLPKLSITVICTVFALSAQADISWSFTGSGEIVSPTEEFLGAASGGSPTDVVATVTGWSDPQNGVPIPGASGTLYDDGGALAQQSVKKWSGLGVLTAGMQTDTPDHATGNGSEPYSSGCSGPCYADGPNEMVLFNFKDSASTDVAVTISDVAVGWWENDSDITVLAYTPTGGQPSTPDLAGSTWAGLEADGWSFVGHYFNVGGAATSWSPERGGYGSRDISGDTVGISSSYWLVGALNNRIRDPYDADYPDFVKIAGLTGAVVTPPPGGGGGGGGPGVPEPATIVLLAAGLPLLGKRKLFTRRG